MLAALALTACETTAEKSAKLEKLAKREAAAATYRRRLTHRGLSIPRTSTKVTVTATGVLHSSEGAAVVVTVRNASATTLRDIPIEITVKDARGAPVYTNPRPVSLRRWYRCRSWRPTQR